MFRPYMWAILRLRFFNLQISYTRCVGRLGGWAGGGRDFVVSIVGTMTLGVILQKFDIITDRYFHCYTVHVAESLKYHTSHCTYIEFIISHIITLKRSYMFQS